MQNLYFVICIRCDSKELNKLRLHANCLLKKEAEESIFRSQICVMDNLMEPRCYEDEAELFGSVGAQGFDGIHLRGRLGAEKLFRTLCTIVMRM